MVTKGPDAQPDRRVRRSRAAIRDAFLALVSERGYEQVTVDDVARRADIARATFYAHFRDKNELLTSIVGELTAELATAAMPLTPSGTTPLQGAAVRELFRFADANRDLYRVVVSGEAGGRARHAYVEALIEPVVGFLTAYAAAHGSRPRVAPDILARAWVGSLTAVLEWWLTVDDPPTADEAVLHFMRYAVPGLADALGLDPDEVRLDESLLGPERSS
jgi:AcrR family transcriptional regulator